MNRHQLLHVTDAGWQMLREPHDRYGWPWPDLYEYWQQQGCPPAIMCRQPKSVPLNMMAVAWSFPERCHGIRMGGSALVRRDQVLSGVDPYRLSQNYSSLPSPWEQLLAELSETSREHQIEIGLFGSCALQIATGLPYLHQDSDLDLLLRAADPDGLLPVWEQCRYLSLSAGIKLDAEIDFGSYGQIKAEELFSGSKTLLLKGVTGARLVTTEEIESIIEKTKEK